MVIAHRVLVWGVLVATIGLHVAGLVLGTAARPGAQTIIVQGPIAYLGGALIGATYATVFAILASRRPENRVGWIFGAVALVSGISNAVWGYVSNATETIPPRLPGPEIAAMVDALLLPVWTYLLVTLVLVFPDGAPLSRWWGRWVTAAAVLGAMAAVGIGLGSNAMPLFGIDNPFALPGAAGVWLGLLGSLALGVQTLIVVPGVSALLVRYRRADATGRLQLQWLGYAVVIFATIGIGFFVLRDSAFAAGSTIGDLVWLAFCAGASLVPVAALIAILRHDLYQIETIIGRTFVYASLTAILAGLYAAAIRLFNWFFVELSGESSDAALVLTTLVLATTFTPIKGRLERFASERWGTEEEPEPAAGMPALDLDDPQVRAFADHVATIVRQQLEAVGVSPHGTPRR